MRYLKILGLCLAPWALLSQHAHAFPTVEISAMGSYSKSNLGGNSYETTRRYTGTLGVNILPITEIELSYTHTHSFVNQDPVQTIDVVEQVLGLSVVQSLVPPDFWFQPYLKAGAAQYNRRQSGTIYGVGTRTVEAKSPSALLGAGIRIFFFRNLSLKIEGVTYLPDFHISQGKNNFAIQGGFGWSF